MLSTGVAASNITRLLKHGEDGKTVEMVADSWTAKPGARSSRSITFSVPPGFPAGMGVGAGAPVLSAAFLAGGLAVWADAVHPWKSNSRAANQGKGGGDGRSEGSIESSFVGEAAGWAEYTLPPC
jgi:hypothetical protein